ncbi:CoA transferase [Halobellus sp. Atlit-38R]|uniref:CaiB/BaiF CoA transferase family protein n=1 Tax=Halobellus sp. Atlit-38R TaxID=2282131 RepID=UPI000EF18B50|nr:CoA transferase [Halobellus sp. Atlit-38R]RLM83638.1 CoA transferase [Halobellus sp. Atlit-38R]
MEQPLEGIEVLDVGQIYNGPYCGLILSYLGADVIKVEPPFGEPLRSRVEEGEPEELIMLNSNKKGITLNLKSERGKELFKSLVDDVDVVIENFSLGTMEKLGLGYETLSSINPELIYAQGTGFGRTGPKKDRLAMDLIVQATSGVMDVTGYPDQEPTKTGIAPGDFFGGIHLVSGILAALYERERTGSGQLVEVGMYDAVVPSLLSQLAIQYRDPSTPSRTGNRHSAMAKAPYNAYETKDGFITIICASDEHWRQLLKLMGREDLLGEDRFETNVDRVNNIDEVDGIVESWTKKLETDIAEERLLDRGIPCGAVQTIQEVLNDPHLQERDSVVEIDHPEAGEIKVPGSPIKFSESPDAAIEPSPTKGEHNEEVLRSRLGLSDIEIEELRSNDII